MSKVEEFQQRVAAASRRAAEDRKVPQITDLEQRAREAHARLAAAQDAWDQTHSEDQGAYNRLEAARNAAHEADETLAQQQTNGKLPEWDVTVDCDAVPAGGFSKTVALQFQITATTDEDAFDEGVARAQARDDILHVRGGAAVVTSTPTRLQKSG